MSKTLWWVILIVCGLAALLAVGYVKVSRDPGVKSTPRERLIAMIVAAVTIALTAFLYFKSNPVIECTESGGDVHAERGMKIGWGDGGTVVINHAQRPLRVEEYTYGIGLGFQPDPVVIPPGTEHHFSEDIEYIGPGNHPPGSIMSDIAIDSRRWLTWDR